MGQSHGQQSHTSGKKGPLNPKDTYRVFNPQSPLYIQEQREKQREKELKRWLEDPDRRRNQRTGTGFPGEKKPGTIGRPWPQWEKEMQKPIMYVKHGLGKVGQ